MGLLEDAESDAQRKREREEAEATRVRGTRQEAQETLDQCAREFAEAAKARSIPAQRIARGRHREGWLLTIWEHTNDYAINETLLVTADGTWYWVKKATKMSFWLAKTSDIYEQVEGRDAPRTLPGSIRKAFTDELSRHL